MGTKQIKSNREGKCPYCSSANLVNLTEQPDPRRTRVQCSDCSGFSVKSTRTGKQHPLVDRTDETSSPAVIINE
jgi:transposase-like protein